MKLLSFAVGSHESFGLEHERGIADLGARTSFSSMRALIAAPDGLQAARRVAAEAPADFAPNEIRYRIPVPDADKIICIGVNYPDRNAEYKDGSDAPKYPSMFLRTRGSFTGHGEPLMLPPESPQFDYEGEIVVVIGKAGRRIARENALSHIFGVSICNEGSVRDWMRHAKFNVTQGKNFEKSGSIGPWIVPVGEAGELKELRVSSWVNDELRQDDVAGRMLFPLDYLISYISAFTALLPGDIIVTGTPTGSGARFDPPRYLVDGDAVRVSVSGIGTLENRVQREAI
ncbi:MULTISPECIES: fumarylacetoacetate hydrolase family protein [unclassified Chelatococcus]|uniref:fumarylacetoacetate hydrolase family protein n=1 Tax=unclassified Chelatococcus TaxID=2638111 RepID=UPI001BCEFCDE|nr:MULTISPECIES: fumarylacetoacetate hydrolase family protein [unclassified Chelatococcus]CAH1649207.1 2-keto-4-pentenoate hydratase/2-oxohepta-3-ene-1,7-dioic acid hydratase in catechol pathway [Hyphomicrobiales bacterium]MBS7741796.1 fumarylacetoacetate hydrolase family protein [Chelatococcus sp. HY11]MBX3541406.1 fumarylacetoacetate hydrolase family protein [Chelatococcus sp.]MCO5074700.1 fumarylacetoacetate hydrolase family protein [Chelatococcus sp.]CAH1691783.1 2-keto-4-pentenoate hydrat